MNALQFASRLALLVLSLAAPQFSSRRLAAGQLDRHELPTLLRYLDRLADGAPSDAQLVDDLVDLDWPAVETIVRRYVELPAAEPAAIEPHTHRAFQALLERTTRTALQPWTLVETYSPEFARFLAGSPLAAPLFRRLIDGAPDRRAWDLAVRMTPGESLDFLRDRPDDSRQVELLEAWNRRLARGRVSQPIPRLDERLAAIASATLAAPATSVGGEGGDAGAGAKAAERLQVARLEFLGRWPTTRDAYQRRLVDALASSDRPTVSAALRVQQLAPARMDASWTQLEARLAAGDAELVELTLQAAAFDAANDHSAALRDLWPRLPRTLGRARYFALLAMAAHPTGNQRLALAALVDEPFELLDAALGVLRHGDPKATETETRQAVDLLLTRGERGREEALRLAGERRIAGFEKPAVQIALDPRGDAILRQTALAYLQQAPGGERRALLPLHQEKNADVRLAAIQAFGPPTGLTAEDRDEIGPALIQAAQNDPSEGHRQEAIYALGLWKDRQAAPFFRQLLEKNPPLAGEAEMSQPEHYWRYRFRLVALVGLARLDDRPAWESLQAVHRTGGPNQRMDVLLGLSSLERCPDWALVDLEDDEPKLLATAVRLTVDFGSPTQQARMQAMFAHTPVWRAFRGTGVDDHNLWKMLESPK